MGRKEKRLGLALGGGGARGLAHVGVFRLFEEENLPLDIIVGTSIGALVGGAYASGLGPDDLEGMVDEYLDSDLFKSSALKTIEDAQERNDSGLVQKIQYFLKDQLYLIQAIFKLGILSIEEFQETINFFIPDISIEDTRIPFRSVATDLVSGEQIVFSQGSLRQAIRASCAVPIAMEPIREGERLLLDGGIIGLIPSSVARKEGADIVIAVAVDKDICFESEFRNIIGVYSRMTDIMSNRLKDYEMMEADIVIQPEVGDLHWSEFSYAKPMIAAGEEAAREKLDDIRNVIPGRKKWFTLKQLLKTNRDG